MTTTRALEVLRRAIATLENANDTAEHADALCDLRRRLDILASEVSGKVAAQRARARGSS
jgi:hypothetical protein